MSLALPSLCTEHDIVMLGRTGRQRQPAGPAFCSVSDPAVSFYSPSVGPQRDGTMAPHHRENLNSGLLTLGSILPLKNSVCSAFTKSSRKGALCLGPECTRASKLGHSAKYACCRAHTGASPPVGPRGFPRGAHFHHVWLGAVKGRACDCPSLLQHRGHASTSRQGSWQDRP